MVGTYCGLVERRSDGRQCPGVTAVTTRQAAQLYANQGKQPPAELAEAKVSKYSARKKEIDGHMFDSTAEALAYQVLRRWEQAGAISGLKLQPRFVIVEASLDAQGLKVRAREYVADFEYSQDVRRVVVDVKGVSTQLYSLKKRLFTVQYLVTGIVNQFLEWTPQDVRRLACQ